METINAATIDDVPQLAELLGILFSQEAEMTVDREKQDRGLRIIIDTPALGRIYAARAGEKVVGMVSLLFSVSTAEGSLCCWLEDMVVRPEYRGGGLGTRLIQHAINEAKAMGMPRITLLTDRDNAGAIRFYERQGFERSTMTPLRLYFGK